MIERIRTYIIRLLNEIQAPEDLIKKVESYNQKELYALLLKLSNETNVGFVTPTV